MSLASNYAALLSKGADVEKTLAYMKHRGHLSLVSQIVRILKREPAEANAATVLLAKESDGKKYSAAIREALAKLGADAARARTVIDERVVGGYQVRAGGKTLDHTFRSALVSIYQNATR